MRFLLQDDNTTSYFSKTNFFSAAIKYLNGVYLHVKPK